MKKLLSILFLQFFVTYANADCFVERNDTAGVLRCEADGDFTLKVECLNTSKNIAARSQYMLKANNATFSIGNITWSSDLILGKSIRLAGFNKRKNEQDFYGLGHDFSTIVNAMKKGRHVTINYNQTEHVISLSGFTKSYNMICL